MAASEFVWAPSEIFWAWNLINLRQIWSTWGLAGLESGQLGRNWGPSSLGSVQLGPYRDLFSLRSAKPEALEAQTNEKHTVCLGFLMFPLVDSWGSGDPVLGGLGCIFGSSRAHLGSLLEHFGFQMVPRGAREAPE